jgi:hypothetical protein
MLPTSVLTRYGTVRLTAESQRFELRAVIIATAVRPCRVGRNALNLTGVLVQASAA